MDRDRNQPAVFGGVFPSREEAEAFMRLEDGRPKRFLEALYLQGDFIGRIEARLFEKKSNRAEELYGEFPYGERIVRVLREKFRDKLKRRVNTAIVLYDFDLGNHFTGHNLSQMRECRTGQYHIFHVDDVYPYRESAARENL